MALNEVNKAPTQSELGALKHQYRSICKKYDDMKYQLQDKISWDDWEVLSSNDFFALKECYIQRKKLYWKIHRLENPEDTATETAYRFLNTMDHNEQVDFLMEHDLTTHKLIERIKNNPNFLKEVTA